MQYFTQHTNTEMSSAEQEAKAAREDWGALKPSENWNGIADGAETAAH
jgi:hypothetical protein